MAYTTIDDPTEYFNTKIFTGDNSANNAVTGVGFQPDFIWFKNRSAANDHALVDSVRGRKALSSNNNSAELTLNADKDFQSFDSDGFTVDVVEQLNSFNKSGDSIVTWNWLAGTSFTNDASATGIGTLDSAGSVNTTSGFSIISYTGGTDPESFAHGLGVVPTMIIVKDRSTSGGWRVYHEALGNGKVLALDGTIPSSTSDAWNATTPSSSVVTVGNDTITNGDGTTHIAYCFAEKQGYSKFGSYTGNGSTDGVFCFTGMKVGWLMIKRTDASGYGWSMFDNKRDPDNVVEGVFNADTATAEDTASDWLDFTSTGFKIRFAGGDVNASGATYIYMAFAENPFVTSSGVPATAR